MSETENKPPPSIPIADVAHVVRNALVPANYAAELLRDAAPDDSEAHLRAERVLTGINTVLAYVDGLMNRVHAEEP